jgi:hypothetical protein
MDYSKWDKFATEQSDSDQEEVQKPIVTKFDSVNGAKIKIDKEGYSVVDHIQDENLAKEKIMPKNEIIKSKEMPLNNGAICEKYSWNQDRYEVFLTIPIASTLKAKQISVTIDKKFISIVSVVNNVTNNILEGELRYEVSVPVDKEAEWEVKESPSLGRAIHLTMVKKSPIPGAFIWWSNVFVGEDSIDVTQVPGRRNPQPSIEKNSMNDIWREAHKSFEEKVAAMEKIEVDF